MREVAQSFPPLETLRLLGEFLKKAADLHKTQVCATCFFTLSRLEAKARRQLRWRASGLALRAQLGPTSTIFVDAEALSA
jgi:hypothetical protein